MKLANKQKQKERKRQENRIKELLSKYAGFIIMPEDEKIKVIRLCVILSYVESAQKQNLTIDECILSLTLFLDKITSKYVSEEERGEDAVQGS